MIGPALAWLIAAGRSVLWRIDTAADARTDRTHGEVAIAPVGCEDMLVKMVGAEARRAARRRAIGNAVVAPTRPRTDHG